MNGDVFLIGAYGSGNLGDDVLFRITLSHTLKYTEARRVAVLCRPSNYLADLAPGAVLIDRQANYDVNAKVCVYGGGTQFYSFSQTFTKLALAKFALRYPGYTFRKVTRQVRQQLHAEHTAMLGLGFGPFEEGGAGSLRCQSALKKCDFVYVRDAWSYEFCQRHGVDHARLACDMAFASPFRDELAAHARRWSAGDDRIALIVRDWPHGARHDNYLEQLRHAAHTLRREGYEIDLFAFLKEPSTVKRTLVDCGRWIQWNPKEMSDVEFIAQLSQYQLVVTSRFHGAVFAYLLKRPVIGINIDPKIGLFFDQVGLPDLVWSSPYGLEELNAKISLALQSFPDESALDKTLTELSSRADGMLSEYERYLERCLHDRA